MTQDDPQAGEDVDQHHGGDDGLGGMRNAANAADDDHAHQRRHDESVDPGIGVEEGDLLLDRAQRLAHLEGITRPQGTTDGHDAEQNGQHLAGLRPALLRQAARQVFHRPAHDMPVRAHLAVHLRQGGLGKLGGHAEETGDDHPEYRPWSPDTHRNGHPGDIPQSHRGRQRGGQCLEGRHFTRRALDLVLAAQDQVGMAKHAQVDEAHAYRQEGRAEHQPGHHEGHLAFAGQDVEKEGFGEKGVHGAEEIVQGPRGRLRGLRQGKRRHEQQADITCQTEKDRTAREESHDGLVILLFYGQGKWSRQGLLSGNWPRCSTLHRRCARPVSEL